MSLYDCMARCITSPNVTENETRSEGIQIISFCLHILTNSLITTLVITSNGMGGKGKDIKK